LRRAVSLSERAEMRAFISLTTFSSTCAACAFSSRFDEVRMAPSSRATTWATIWRTAGVPSTSFVWPSNCGSGSRTVTTAVRPASASSFSTLSVPALSLRAFAATWSRMSFSSDCSKPARCEPPLGVAMMFTNVCTTVS
jgi:hypothetical protein